MSQQRTYLDQYPSIPWREMAQMRDKLIHPDSLPGRISDREVVGVGDG